MSHMKRLAEEMAELNAELTAPQQPEIRRAWPNGPSSIVPSAPGEPVEYGRPSGLDLFSDPRRWESWHFKRLLDGTIARPDIHAMWRPEALEHKAQLAVIKELRKAGGAWAKADLGTEFHADFAAYAVDRTAVPRDEFRAAADALLEVIEAMGWTIVAVERFVVDDERRLAGTFDILVRDRNGQHFIVDIKTGQLHSLAAAMQCFTYARAPYYFTQGEALDGTEDVREPKPECSLNYAYVAQVDIDAGTVKLHRLDLAPCEELFRLRDQILALRELNLFVDVTPEAANLAAVDAHFPGTVDVTPTISDEWREWMRTRMAAIVDAGMGDELRRRWPADIPTLKSGDPIPTVDGQRLAQMCAEIESEASLPFPEPFDDGPSRRPRKTWPTRRPLPDEGDTVDEFDLVELKAYIANLDDAAKAWMVDIVAQSGKKGRPITMGSQGKRTQRRLAAHWAVAKLAGHDDDDVVRAVLSLAIGTEVQPGHNLGEAFGSLTIDEARIVERIADAIDSGVLNTAYHSSGVTLAGDLSAVIAA